VCALVQRMRAGKVATRSREHGLRVDAQAFGDLGI
jgi:hypothetical protein